MRTGEGKEREKEERKEGRHRGVFPRRGEWKERKRTPCIHERGERIRG